MYIRPKHDLYTYENGDPKAAASLSRSIFLYFALVIKDFYRKAYRTNLSRVAPVRFQFSPLDDQV
jgi:hypothetical protein